MWWVSSVQFTSVAQSCTTLCNPVDCSRPGFPVLHHLQSLLKLISIELVVILSNHLILCCSFLLLLSIISSIRVFSNESVIHIRWPEYWSFTFSISPSSEHPRLISFRMGWLDLLTVQETLKSLLQHHSSIPMAPAAAAQPAALSHEGKPAASSSCGDYRAQDYTQAPLSTGFSKQEYWSGLP